MFHWEFDVWLVKSLQNTQPPSAFKFKNPAYLRTKLGCLRGTDGALFGSPSFASPIRALSPNGWLCDSTVISSVPGRKHRNLCFMCAGHTVSIKISTPEHSRGMWRRRKSTRGQGAQIKMGHLIREKDKVSKAKPHRLGSNNKNSWDSNKDRTNWLKYLDVLLYSSKGAHLLCRLALFFSRFLEEARFLAHDQRVVQKWSQYYNSWFPCASPVGNTLKRGHCAGKDMVAGQVG